MQEHNSIRKSKILANWLFIGVGMIVFQVLLGGITRLTGSGLSITEWKPLLGAIPPMNEADWQIAFDKYKQIGQFRFINADFSLSQFKFIYFWEWLHRNWARFMGLVFIVPFIYFLIKNYFTKSMAVYFAGIFALGILQGAIGWIMVQSGVNPDDVYVSHIKLAYHFIAALLLLVFIYWFALLISAKKSKTINNKTFGKLLILLIAILCVQLFYGAFVAGLKAATVAPTWPLVNGEIIPSSFWGKSWLYNPINVQFIHRNIGYLVLGLLVFIYFKYRNVGIERGAMLMPLIFVCIQVILGVSSILLSTKKAINSMGSFEWAALLHQLCAIFLLMSIIKLYFLATRSHHL